MGITNISALIILFGGNSSKINVQNTKTQVGHKYVDLGLPVTWPVCNIGASSPEEYGNIFARGETHPMSCHIKMTYKFSEGNHTLEVFHTLDSYLKALTDYTKCFGNKSEKILNDSKLGFKDDMKNVQWGKPWRMPTLKEMKELVGSYT